MPQYEYHCNGCKKDFTLYLTFKEKEEKKEACPHCGSRKVKQLISGFFAKTSRKS